MEDWAVFHDEIEHLANRDDARKQVATLPLISAEWWASLWPSIILL